MGLKRPFRDENGNVYQTTREAADRLGIHHSHISGVLRKNEGRRSVGGHIFIYLDETPPSPQTIEELRLKKRLYRQANPQNQKKYKLKYVKGHIETVRKQRREWAAKNPDKVLNTRLKLTYGISKEQYDLIMATQNGLCAVCKTPPSGQKKTGRLYVDHCHKTGKVRGLLCHTCNFALGHVKENAEIAQRLVEYILSFNSTESKHPK